MQHCTTTALTMKVKGNQEEIHDLCAFIPGLFGFLGTHNNYEHHNQERKMNHYFNYNQERKRKNLFTIVMGEKYSNI